MTVREIDELVLKGITKDNIYTEIHRLEGRIDFLMFCKEIPEDIREYELHRADAQMNILQAKLLIYTMKGEA